MGYVTQEQLRGPRLEEMKRVWASSETTQEAASRLGCHWTTLAAAALAEGLGAKPTGLSWEKRTFANRDPERNRKIVQLRESGLTYQEIGDKYRLTRERVRQIIKHQREDLCHRRIQIGRAIARANPPVTKKCKTCGENFTVEYGKRQQAHCSQRCGAIAWGKKQRKNKRMPTGVYKIRNQSRYQARARINSELRHLGMYDTIAEAHQAYLDATGQS